MHLVRPVVIGLACWALLPGAAGCGRGAPADGRPDRDPDPADTSPPDTGATPLDTVERLRAALQAEGLIVGEGAARELSTDACCDWASCYLFNPDNDYLIWDVPRSPGQAVANPLEDEAGLSGVFRMRHDEAIVAVGRTPPGARYFSYRSYLHDRYFEEIDGRLEVFGSFGDSLNHLVVGTGPGGPFEAEIVVVTVADAGTEAKVRRAAEAVGLGDRLNIDVIDAERAVFGLHAEADTFRMQHRIALFDDTEAGEAWLADPSYTILRVTPEVEAPLEPLAPPPLRPTGTGTDESGWAEALDALEVALVEAYPDWTPHPLPTVVPAQDEDGCPQGCNRDTYFGVTAHYILPPHLDGFVLAYGVNHERTGKSVYSNVTAYGVEQMVGVGSVHSGEMGGSARAYLPDHPLVDDLYVVRIARSCAGEAWCIEVPLECPGFGTWAEGSVGFRAYVEEATATGPLPSELLIDRAALFTRPQAR